MEDKYRLVIDTSVIVRAFISTGSFAALLIDKWFDEEFILLISKETYQEVEEVLSRQHFKQKYRFSKHGIELLLNDMIVRGQFVEPYPIPIESRDSKDTKFLCLAIAGSANYLVSADEDLLTLKNHPDIGALKIVTVEEILNKLK